MAVNAYGAPNNLATNPRFADTLTHWMSAAGVAGKPLADHRMEYGALSRKHPPQSARLYRLHGALAGLGRPDALWLRHCRSERAGEPGNWNGFNDPASLAMMPAAALLFRQGHAQTALKSYELTLSPEQFYGRNITPKTSQTIRTLSEQSKLRIALPHTPALPWLKTAKPSRKVLVISDPDKDYIPASQHFVCSDTRELCRNWQTGVFSVDTPRSQIATGWLGGKTIALENVTVQLTTKNAAIAVQSLDGAPINRSKKLLISLATQARPANKDALPFLSEPLTGLLQITNKNRLKLYALAPQAAKSASPCPAKTAPISYAPSSSSPPSGFCCNNRPRCDASLSTQKRLSPLALAGRQLIQLEPKAGLWKPVCL